MKHSWNVLGDNWVSDYKHQADLGSHDGLLPVEDLELTAVRPAPTVAPRE